MHTLIDKAGLVVNYNTVPFDVRKPFDPSGIRIGTAAVTSRGFKDSEMVQVGEWLDMIISDPTNKTLIEKTAADVASFCKGFPAPGLGISE